MKDKKNLLTLHSRRFLLAVCDAILFNLSTFIIIYLDSPANLKKIEYLPVFSNPIHIIITTVITIIIFALLGLYKSIWTFAGINEIVRCVGAVGISTAVVYIIDLIFYPDFHLFYLEYFLIFVLNIVFIGGIRMLYRALRSIVRSYSGTKTNSGQSRKKVMIVGAGYMGNFVINDIRAHNEKFGKPVVAVDDNKIKLGSRISGIKVEGTCQDIPQIAKKRGIDTIAICIPSASEQRKKEIIDISMSTGCKIMISPTVNEFYESGKENKQIRKVEISDLLARPEVSLDKAVCKYLTHSTVLVTGGGGSIGSEICTQVARYNPKKIVIFDIYENNAFELQNELLRLYKDQIEIDVRIGSVRDIDRLRYVFNEFKPDVVFHAAAHKHVPLMEDNPCEAVKNNIFGTYNTAVVADEFKVKKFVLLSTDKAVNPTNVMGTTKRITELVVQYMNRHSENTRYAAVRFGNVLGSNGSVIPIFKKQIERGGPVCVTHPDITRYFMTIPEAAQLVAQAGGLSTGGEVFVLDMGEPVKIMDLATNLIKLSGFTVDEIGIEITGLRPGEKLYEELSLESETEGRHKTANNKIFVTGPAEINDDKFYRLLMDLKEIDNSNVRQKLKKIVPNFHQDNID